MNSVFKIQSLNKRLAKVVGCLTIIFALTALFSLTYLPAPDWYDYIRPGVIEIINGNSPYTLIGFSNPPWVAIPLIPFALLPDPIGRALLATATLLTIAYVSIRFGAKPLAVILILLSPPALQCLLYGQIDWLVLLAYLLPPQIGLLFAAIKPQVGIGAVIFWLVVSYQKGKFREVFKVFWPLIVALVLSILLYGFWFLTVLHQKISWKLNFSVFPYSIPLGIYLVFRAIRKESPPIAAAASPFFSPYVQMHSWIGPLLAVGSSPLAVTIVYILLWGMRLLNLY